MPNQKCLRNQISRILDPSPMMAAVIEWYNAQSDAIKDLIDQDLMRIILSFDQSPARIGIAGALELYGAYIAIRNGWKIRAR